MSLALRALAATAVLALAQPGLASDVRWLTQTQPQNAQYPTESAAIAAATAAGFTVNRNEFQVLGLNLADALRMASLAPAHALGERLLGAILPGATPNIILMDELTGEVTPAE